MSLALINLRVVNLQTGVALPGAVVSVYKTGTTILADLFDANTEAPIANPFIADSTGLAQFKITAGPACDVVWSSGAYTSPRYVIGVEIAGASQLLRGVPEDFGATGNGVSNDFSAVVAAKTYAMSNGGVLPLLGGSSYNCGSSALDLSGVVLDPGPGAVISGNLILTDSWVVTAPMNLQIVPASGSPWTMPLSPKHKAALTEKSIWVSGADATRSLLQSIDCASELQHYRVLFPGSDTFTSLSTGITYTASAIAVPAQDTTGFRVSLAPLRPREELTAYFDDPVATAGDYGRAAMVRFSRGYVVVWMNRFGAATVAYKAIGLSVGTIGSITWAGRTEAPAYTGRAAYLTVRLYDWQTVGVLVSGKEIWRGKVGVELPAQLGFATRAGFGVVNSTDYVTIGNWTRRTALNEPTGVKPVGLLVIGDSLSEPWHMAYARQLREALYGYCGARVTLIDNYALGGQTSAQQLTKLTTSGVPAGTTHVVGTLGANDQQVGVAPSTLQTTWSSILSLVTAAGAKLHFVLGIMPYTRGDAPGHGSDFSNYLNSHIYRTALLRWAADNGVSVTDTNATLPPQIPSYIGSDDDVLRDNVHWAPVSMRSIAWHVARDLAGLITPKMSNAMPPVDMSPFFINGWAASGEFTISISRDGMVRLHGAITKSGASDQTVAQLPVEIAPSVERLFIAPDSSGGETTRVGITTGGALYVNGVGSATTVWVDGITWRPAGFLPTPD